MLLTDEQQSDVCNAAWKVIGGTQKVLAMFVADTAAPNHPNKLIIALDPKGQKHWTHDMLPRVTLAASAVHPWPLVVEIMWGLDVARMPVQ